MAISAIGDLTRKPGGGDTQKAGGTLAEEKYRWVTTSIFLNWAMARFSKEQ